VNDPYVEIRKGQKPDQVNARVFNVAGDTRIWWGDGTDPQTLELNRWKPHQYARHGGYRVIVKTLAGLHLADSHVVIRPVTAPPVSVHADADHPGVIVATVDADELDDTGILPHFRVHWALPQPVPYTDMWGLPGNSVRYTTTPGQHRVKVEDLGTHRDFQQVVTIDQPDLDFTVTATGTSATLTVTKAAQGKDLMVRWGDGGIREPVPDNKTATHVYPSTVADATYLVQLGYSDASVFDTKPLTIPGGKS
jgi:hypothetical protein